MSGTGSGRWRIPRRRLVWCTDLVSGVRLYAQFPAEVIDDAPPWSTWLGALAPAEGIWRVTRAGTWLSPVEGDAIAEYAEDAIWHMLHRITGERGVYPPVLEQVRFGQAEPYCVRWESGEEPEPEFGAFASPVVARLAPRLAAWVWQKRAERVPLQNTDGEPMVLTSPPAALPAPLARQSLDDFLLDILDLHPGQVISAVRTVAGRTGRSGPPMTAGRATAPATPLRN